MSEVDDKDQEFGEAAKDFLDRVVGKSKDFARCGMENGKIALKRAKVLIDDGAQKLKAVDWKAK